MTATLLKKVPERVLFISRGEHQRTKPAGAHAAVLTEHDPSGTFTPVRVLGLDVGSRTIGVAVTDELGVCAHGVTTLQRRGTRRDVEQVNQLAHKYETTRLVVGLPYDVDGQEGDRAKRVRVFVDALTETGFAVELWDERYTTVEAERILLQADLSRQRRKAVIDKVAAQVILQGWLDAQGPRANE